LHKCIFYISVLLVVLVSSIRADTHLNGSYETSLDWRRDTGSYKWQLGYPWHRMELRLYTNPFRNTEFYFKTYGNLDRTYYYNKANYKYQPFQLVESHIHYTIGTKDRLDFYLFAKESRFYLGDPLLYLVNNDKDKWDNDGSTDTPNVAGSTIEMNGFLPGFGLKFFNARMFKQNVDGYGLRVYDNIINERMRIGGTATYKKWQGGINNYNLVYAFDIWFNLSKNYITAESAISETPSDYTLKNNSGAYKVEYRRSLNFSDFGFNGGNLGLIFSLRDIGKNFRAYLSKDYDNDRKFDQQGYYIETKYRFPLRAITLTYHRDYYKKHNINYSETENYFESYIEFIKDFNLKIWYKSLHQFNWDKVEITKLDGTKEMAYVQDDTWSHFFTQLEMQNSFSYVKFQFKIMNIYTEYLRYIYGVEYSINITDKLKSLNRILVADEIYRTRNTLWSQIQYDFGNNVNFYLEYGNDSYVNDDLVNDNDFVESDNVMEHKVHLYIKIGF